MFKHDLHGVHLDSEAHLCVLISISIPHLNGCHNESTLLPRAIADSGHCLPMMSRAMLQPSSTVLTNALGPSREVHASELKF